VWSLLLHTGERFVGRIKADCPDHVVDVARHRMPDFLTDSIGERIGNRLAQPHAFFVLPQRQSNDVVPTRLFQDEQPPESREVICMPTGGLNAMTQRGQGSLRSPSRRSGPSQAP